MAREGARGFWDVVGHLENVYRIVRSFGLIRLEVVGELAPLPLSNIVARLSFQANPHRFGRRVCACSEVCFWLEMLEQLSMLGYDQA